VISLKKELKDKERGRIMYTCAVCNEKACKKGQGDKYPKNCPSREVEKLEEIREMYDEENLKIAYNAALVESQGYCKWTRIEEIIDFANKCGYKNLGLAFCTGLSKEALICYKILKHHGFEVNSIICKNGSIPKEFLNIQEHEKVRPNSYEPMCNPIGQAEFLNKMNTDFNILLGLCVGHDSLFFKYTKAPTTVLAVKDRVLCHNPISALYLSEGYYKKKLYPQD